MKETLRHREVFEAYYRLGAKRSYTEVSQKCSISRTSLKNWSQNFNWPERIHLRDIENAKKIEKRTDRTVVATKANYRKDIEDSIKIIKATILSAVDPATGKLKIKTKTPADIKSLVAAFVELAKLDLLLVGEDTENIKHEHKHSVKLDKSADRVAGVLEILLESGVVTRGIEKSNTEEPEDS